jgi:hypothetical protein
MSQVTPTNIIPTQDQAITRSIIHTLINTLKNPASTRQKKIVIQNIAETMQHFNLSPEILRAWIKFTYQTTTFLIQQQQQRPLKVGPEALGNPLTFANNNATREKFPDISSYDKAPTRTLEMLIPINPDDLFKGLKPEDYRSLNEHADPDFFGKLDKIPGIY